MNNYQKALIEEHSQLVIRIKALQDDVYGDNSETYNKIEFANRAIQLAAMKKYEECLRARLNNSNIIFEDDHYFEDVAHIQPSLFGAMSEKGNDYDKDGEKE